MYLHSSYPELGCINKLNRENTQNQSSNDNKFVEILVDKPTTESPNLFLKKISIQLEFDKFSFELRGSIGSKKLVKLIYILEQPC